MNTAGTTGSEWDGILRLADDVITSVFDRMRVAHRAGDFESALQWAQTASSFIVFGGTFGRLASVELEGTTVAIARELPNVPSKGSSSGPRRFLHVLTEAYELFGHTKLCRKWIELDPTNARHDVVLTDQYGPAPGNLRESVEKKGGKLKAFDRTQPLLTRAKLLRELAHAEADVVVLHVHPGDVLPNVAFGVAGGPPVMYVNHADHEFWVGGAISDLVLEIRESGQEWTRKHRDIPRTHILPIPLEEDPLLQGGADATVQLRRAVREEFGIRENEFLFLTIGSARKYQPMRGLSFLEAAEEILKLVPNSKILAVGPRPVGEWLAASQRTGGRLIPIGNQSDLGRFHAAADLYLEGMPAGSLTALLEVCLADLACVRAPAQVRPPHASDGAALAPVAQPANVAEYIREAMALAHDTNARKQRAAMLRRLVHVTHCDAGWGKRLVEVQTQLPMVHSVYSDQKPTPIIREETEYKLEYAYQTADKARAELLATFVERALRSSEEVRRVVEQALPAALMNTDQLRVDAEKLFIAVFPELQEKLATDIRANGCAVLELQNVVRQLMQFAAEGGRRYAAWELAVRLMWLCPALWRQPNFQKGLVISLPGVLTMARVRKERRQRSH